MLSGPYKDRTGIFFSKFDKFVLGNIWSFFPVLKIVYMRCRKGEVVSLIISVLQFKAPVFKCIYDDFQFWSKFIKDSLLQTVKNITRIHGGVNFLCHHQAPIGNNVLCVPFIERSFCPPLKFGRVFIAFKPWEWSVNCTISLGKCCDVIGYWPLLTFDSMYG